MALVKEVKELIGFGISLGERVAKSLEDGELTWTDAFQFVGVLGEANKALQGIGSIPGELADLSEAEKDELVAYVEAEFDIENDKVERAIELGFEIAASLVQFVAEWRAK